jgi:hypothetical protein
VHILARFIDHRNSMSRSSRRSCFNARCRLHPAPTPSAILVCRNPGEAAAAAIFGGRRRNAGLLIPPPSFGESFKSEHGKRSTPEISNPEFYILVNRHCRWPMPRWLSSASVAQAPKPKYKRGDQHSEAQNCSATLQIMGNRLDAGSMLAKVKPCNCP